MPKLTIELVPKTSFFKNVRSEVTKSRWDSIRKQVYLKAGFRCEVCGGKGRKHPVEAHEIFEYDDQQKVQKLVKIVALCPSCHAVKHFGRTAVVGGGARRAAEHMAKVNGWTISQTAAYISEQFAIWEDRSRYTWHLDLSYLKDVFS